MAPLDHPSAYGYTFLERLNSGSFGDVYLGYNAEGEYVAIKVLYGVDRESIDAELRFCRLLDHPNIVKTHEILEFADGNRWVVSEFCENGDLFGVILPMEGVGDEGRIKKYLGQLVDAVAYLHSYGIIHRDIKPENILITASDDVKLCDFGLSKLEWEQWDEGVGTVAYMAPEVYQLPQHMARYNAKATDIWSLGCTLYTMLAGMLPWEAPCLQDPDYETFRENMGRFDQPQWSRELHDLVSGMLHWDPNRRLTIDQIQGRLREIYHRPWILPSRSRSVRNLAGHVTSHGMKLDEEIRRPRTPPGALHNPSYDYVIFRDGDGGELSDAGSDWHVGSPSRGSGFFPDPRKVIPPPRRTRYDSECLEVEFNPYLEADSPVFLRSRLPSLRSSTTSDDDEEEGGEGIGEGEEGSWFSMGAMSFSSLPRFDSVPRSPAPTRSSFSSNSSVGGNKNVTTSSSCHDSSPVHTTVGQAVVAGNREYHGAYGAGSPSLSPPASVVKSPSIASVTSAASASLSAAGRSPRFVLGDDDDDDDEDEDEDETEDKSEMDGDVHIAMDRPGIAADGCVMKCKAQKAPLVGKVSTYDDDVDQGIGGSLPQEDGIQHLQRNHGSGNQGHNDDDSLVASKHRPSLQSHSADEADPKTGHHHHHHHQNRDDQGHRVRWGDLSERDMSFSVLPRFSSLALDDNVNDNQSPCRCCDEDALSSDDSGVEGVGVLHRSKPIAVPMSGSMRAARMSSRGSTTS